MDTKHRKELIEILHGAGVKPSILEETADSAIDVFNRYRSHFIRIMMERRKIEKELRDAKTP